MKLYFVVKAALANLTLIGVRLRKRRLNPTGDLAGEGT
jgi:hypothetical protein